MEPRVIFPRCLQYLLAIAEHGSYTRAAEAMHVSQPALSQQIRQLEEALQSLLVDRSGRTVRLTDAGELYLAHARRAWGELAAGTRAIQDLQDLTRGSLRLGWTPITDYLTCSLLIEFDSLYPGVTLSTFEMPQDEIEVAVVDGRIDLGIVFSHPLPAEPPSSQIQTKTLFEDAVCLGVGSTHPWSAEPGPVSPQTLEQESLVLLNTSFALRNQTDRYCREHGIQPRIAMETDSLSVIIETVKLGPLVTVLPQTIICTQHGMFPVQLSPEMPRKAVTLICRKGEYRSAACSAFATLASEWVERRCQPAAS